MQYRNLEPGELVEEGDEYLSPGCEDWRLATNWKNPNKQQTSFCNYRRPIKDIRTKLIELSKEMHSVALLMQSDDQSQRMQAKGVELQGASSMVREWLTSMADEHTIQTFVKGRKTNGQT